MLLFLFCVTIIYIYIYVYIPPYPHTQNIPPRHYESLCRFDYRTELSKAKTYRERERPFILYNVPEVRERMRERMREMFQHALFITIKMNFTFQMLLMIRPPLKICIQLHCTAW